ncbi:MAG TPA: TonB-dependent receptor [Flavobacteriales bacterium]|nr:TonB-dependent receptor [Flavobacteriales bacterium]
MRLRLFCALLFLLLAIDSLAQRVEDSTSKLTISGVILDENAQPIPYSAVAARSATDSTNILGVASSLDGKFEIQVRAGTYTVMVSFLSYNEFKKNATIVDTDVDLGALQLSPKTELINEVVVTGEKSYMKMKLDRRVYNVAKDPNNVGSNAQEILETVPSVEVDVDGTVSLRGSSNVRILIDGKPSSLTGISSEDALRQLPGNLIERVEVVTNASARYDAEGEAGILNIVLKKEKRAGINGAFEVNAGYPDNYGASANLNYRKGKVNFFTSVGAQYQKRPGSGYSFQEFFLEDTTFAYEREREQERGGISGNGRFGIDYFINDKTTLTASGMYNRSYNDNTAKLTYTDFDENGTQTQVVTRTDDEIEQSQAFEANLNFRREFDKKDQLLTADFRWFKDEDYEDAKQFEEGSDYTLNQRSDNTENQQNWFAQADYVHPFNENIRLETGLKATLRRIVNDYKVEQLNDSTSEWETLSDFDNNFIFNENIYAAYIIASGKIKRLSIQGGVRAEYSDIQTQLVKTNETNNWDYISFFPSAHLSYEFPSSNSLQLSYSRRISRPRFRELIPFFSLTDNRNFFSGNLEVNPVFTHSAELGHLKTWKNGTLLSSIYYRHREGVVERISQSDSTGFITTFPINLSTEDAGGLELSFSYSLFKWWRVMLNVNAYYSITNGQFENQDFYAETFTAHGRFTSKWTILKKLDIQTAFMYRAPRNTPQGKQLSMYSWDLGLSIDVLKGNGTVTFSAKDMLNSRRRRWEVTTPKLVSTNDFQWRARQFVLSFSYRLNQKKKRERGSGDMGDDF